MNNQQLLDQLKNRRQVRQQESESSADEESASARALGQGHPESKGVDKRI